MVILLSSHPECILFIFLLVLSVFEIPTVVPFSVVIIVGFCAFSVIQFCATAFGYYAQATAAQEIFGHTLQSLRGIKYLYKLVNHFHLFIPR